MAPCNVLTSKGFTSTQTSISCVNLPKHQFIIVGEMSGLRRITCLQKDQDLEGQKYVLKWIL